MLYTLAQTVNEAPLPAWAQLTVNSVMLGLLVYLVTKAAPAALEKIVTLTDKFTEAQQETREDFAKALADTQSRAERQVERCLTHCEEERKLYRELSSR